MHVHNPIILFEEIKRFVILMRFLRLFYAMLNSLSYHIICKWRQRVPVSAVMDHNENQEDLFRKSFKKFKSAKGNLTQQCHPKTVSKTKSKEGEDLEVLLDPTLAGDEEPVSWDKILKERCLHVTPKIDEEEGVHNHKSLGLRCPSTWKIYDVKYPEGLIFIRNPFTPEGQRYWMKRSVVDFPKEEFQFITNIDNLENKEGISIKSKLTEAEFYKKLRWVTFGYHHNWDTKVYSEQNKCRFPEDLADLTSFMAKVLGFSDFKAEAAIANYYHLDSTLSGHVDRSEANQTAPLFSLSFGQSATFLIGGREKSLKPQAILLRSGDVAVMAGNSRLAYHGVPKVFRSDDEPWSLSRSPEFPTSSDTESSSQFHDEEITESLPKRPKMDFKDLCIDRIDWTTFLQEYACKSRINLNIRQVLFPGHIDLAESQTFARESEKKSEMSD